MKSINPESTIRDLKTTTKDVLFDMADTKPYGRQMERDLEAGFKQDQKREIRDIPFERGEFLTELTQYLNYMQQGQVESELPRIESNIAFSLGQVNAKEIVNWANHDCEGFLSNELLAVFTETAKKGQEALNELIGEVSQHLGEIAFLKIGDAESQDYKRSRFMMGVKLKQEVFRAMSEAKKLAEVRGELADQPIESHKVKPLYSYLPENGRGLEAVVLEPLLTEILLNINSVVAHLATFEKPHFIEPRMVTCVDDIHRAIETLKYNSNGQVMVAHTVEAALRVIKSLNAVLDYLAQHNSTFVKRVCADIESEYLRLMQAGRESVKLVNNTIPTFLKEGKIDIDTALAASKLGTVSDLQNDWMANRAVETVASALIEHPEWLPTVEALKLEGEQLVHGDNSPVRQAKLTNAVFDKGLAEMADYLGTN